MDIVLALTIDWLAFGVTPGYLEGIGTAMVIVSVTGLAAWDLMAEVGKKRFCGKMEAENGALI